MPPIIPELDGDAAKAVSYQGGHLQIIAAAGSGKTEVVSQRVAALIAGGEQPDGIVAFTFTQKAAEELKERIRQRVTALVGEAATDTLGRLFVGTIHAYCFRLLQTHVPTYEAYTAIDDNQLVNLLYREGTRLNLKQFGGGRIFRGIDEFRRNVDVLENELIASDDLPAGAFRDSVVKYYEMLDGYRFMSFGTQIVRAVEALTDAAIHDRVTAELRHLVVDEYQDVNPAQERLIELLAKPLGSADLVVVGDDDQAVYQWRGSNVDNIVTFADRYEGVATFNLLVNRRSRPGIVQIANAFAQSIPDRLPKEMHSHRDAAGPSVSMVVGLDDEAAEAAAIAADVQRLHGVGVSYRDIAILVRGKVAYRRILDALDDVDVPVQPGGRSGLFQQPEAAVFGATYAWIADVGWSPGRFIKREDIGIDDLLSDYRTVFELSKRDVKPLSRWLESWKAKSRETDLSVSLVGDFYKLLELLGISTWDTTVAVKRNRLGTIARFSTVLADYESVARRSRRDADNPGEQVGGEVGGEWFYRNLALVLVNYSNGSYDDFDGEKDPRSDGVAVGTVHGAKGLEWPVVFLPSLTKKRFPSSRAGSPQTWLVPGNLFDATRYEGSDGDERRLFYVALTRARDWLALSSHSRVNTNAVHPSPYLEECLKIAAEPGGRPKSVQPTAVEIADLVVSYSDLAAYRTCPQSYLLRNELGFKPPLQSELGYGNAVHHVMRSIAEYTQTSGKVPSAKQINKLLLSEFFLPFANKPAHREMRDKARRLVDLYLNEHKADLLRTWATERPFELYLPGVIVSGRADVIYDDQNGQPGNLAIVDYKTSTGADVEPLQLQVYTDAGRREGLTVSAAFVHDMGQATRHTIDVSEGAIADAAATVSVAAESLSQRDFTPLPERAKCRACDVRRMCGSAKLK